MSLISVLFSEPISTPYCGSSTPGVLNLSLLGHVATGVFPHIADPWRWEDAGGPCFLNFHFCKGEEEPHNYFLASDE